MRVMYNNREVNVIVSFGKKKKKLKVWFFGRFEKSFSTIAKYCTKNPEYFEHFLEYCICNTSHREVTTNKNYHFIKKLRKIPEIISSFNWFNAVYFLFSSICSTQLTFRWPEVIYWPFNGYIFARIILLWRYRIVHRFRVYWRFIVTSLCFLSFSST